jgi:S1-C subfamily serine protease
MIAKAVPTPDVIVKAREKLGLNLEELTPVLAEKYGLTSDSGLLVVGVERGSIANRAKILPGDVIFQLGRFRLETLDDLSALMQHLPDKGVVPIGIHRENEGSGFLHLTFGDEQQP